MILLKKIALVLAITWVALYGYNEILRSNERAQDTAANAAWDAKPLCKGKNDDERSQAALDSGGVCRPF